MKVVRFDPHIQPGGQGEIVIAWKRNSLTASSIGISGSSATIPDVPKSLSKCMASPSPSGLPWPRLVIFDCDGVLFESREANRAFYNLLLTRFRKLPLSEEALDYVHMHTVFEAVDFLFPTEEERLAAHAYRQELDPEPFIRLMVEEPGVKEFLTFLRPAVKTAISTNRTTTIGQVLTLTMA